MMGHADFEKRIRDATTFGKAVRLGRTALKSAALQAYQRGSTTTGDRFLAGDYQERRREPLVANLLNAST